MGKKNFKDDSDWRTTFGKIIKKTLIVYSLDYHDFCQEYKVSEATFRYWCLGKKLPQNQYMEDIKKFLKQNELDDLEKTELLCAYIEQLMCELGAEEAFLVFKRRYPDGKIFVGEILSFCKNVAKHKIAYNDYLFNSAFPTGNTQAIVFDFDGTLTKDKTNCTTWEKIWLSLGYSKRDCQELHKRYNNNEISHKEWCKITEERFIERGLRKENMEKIAAGIHLINGVKKTFKKISDKGIKIYIVSGSIDLIIKNVLGNLNQYIKEVKANYFKFDSDGFLDEIVGTKYDFEGKAYFILQIAEELNISPKDILFVGNSINDKFAYRSGARTLCINPKLVDPSDKKVWQYYIEDCDNLEEVISFFEYDVM